MNTILKTISIPQKMSIILSKSKNKETLILKKMGKDQINHTEFIKSYSEDNSFFTTGKGLSASIPAKGCGRFCLQQTFEPNKLPKSLETLSDGNILKLKGKMQNGKIIDLVMIDNLREDYISGFQKLLEDANAGKIEIHNLTKRFMKKAIEFCRL